MNNNTSTIQTHHAAKSATLQCILEPDQTLNRLPTRGRTLVCTVELDTQYGDDDDHKGVREERGQDAGPVVGCVFGAEDGGADEAAQAATGHESR